MNALGKLLALAAVTAVATFGQAVFHTASAEPGPRGPNLMIAGEDADLDTIPRGNRVFNRVLEAISEQLVRRGFRIYDEIAVTPDIPQGVDRRELAELLERAKLARVPIDVIVVFQIYASAPPARNVRDAHQPRIRIRGRMIGVRSGQYLGSYEYGRDIEFPLIPASCVSGEPPRQCLLETFGDDATLLASAVGDALAVRLAAYLRSDGDPGLILPELPAPSPVVERKPVCDGLDDTPYVLKVKNVDAAGLNRLEEYLTSFACYQHHRVVFSVPPGETDYWYETRANPAHLMQNLRTTLESMNIQGTVSFTGGNVIIVENIPVAPSGVVQAPH